MLKTLEYWSDRARLDEFQAVLDPRDSSGVKNAFLTEVHSLGLKYAARQCGLRHYGTAIDFGCGIGRLTPDLLQLADEVIGIDPVDAMLERARQTHVSPRVRFFAPDALPATLAQPLLLVCVGVMAENLRREDAVGVLARFRERAGEGSHCIVLERVVRVPGCVPADIEPRDVEWYLTALSEAGWRPLGARAVRRAWSRPQVFNALLTPRLPQRLQKRSIASWARIEFFGATRARRGEYVDGSMWAMRDSEPA